MKTMKRLGFTLIELLVVISIIAVIVGATMSNFLGARERARDAKRKAELAQIKNALRLYYNDYSQYPANGSACGGGASGFCGCGATGTDLCSAGGGFASGTAPNITTYMKQLPLTMAGKTWTYNRISPDDFLLVVAIENVSDADYAESQARCGYPAPTPKEFHQCAD